MIVAGFGFRNAAQVDSLADALARTGGDRPVALAILPDKAEHPAIRALAARLDLPIRAVTPPPDTATLTQSTAAKAAHGLGSVAEATALTAAGPGAHLLAPRVVSDDRLATCAIAFAQAIGEPT